MLRMLPSLLRLLRTKRKSYSRVKGLTIPCQYRNGDIYKEKMTMASICIVAEHQKGKLKKATLNSISFGREAAEKLGAFSRKELANLVGIV